MIPRSLPIRDSCGWGCRDVPDSGVEVTVLGSFWGVIDCCQSDREISSERWFQVFIPDFPLILRWEM